jgi:hypothetical protein
VTREALLTQLGYSINDGALAQLDSAISNTPGFDHIGKHIITLHDRLVPRSSFVALSSSKPLFKIKNMATSKEDIDEVNEIIQKWADKFKVVLEKVPGKETFYIKGFKKA